MTDRVLALASDYVPPDNEPPVRFGLKYVESALLPSTPHDRIVRAVSEEVADLVRRARAALIGAGTGDPPPSLREALDALAADDVFPRETLEGIAERERGTALAAEIDAWTARHRALEKRVGWLLRGTPPGAGETLDPDHDADELLHGLTSGFRFEARVLELLAINRIAQSATIGTFFRSTKEAEKNSVMRFFDTYALYGNVFEWGVDSFRGRHAIDRMNEIHGRYYIPNDEMKFVLLQGAFTWLDGADRIGHRRITDRERRGMLASWVRMGRAMHIQDISEDYDAMYAWYRGVCAATADFQPYKKTTFETIVGASVQGVPALRGALFLAAQVAMDDTYRSATGYPAPTKEQQQAVRAVFFTVGTMIEGLPYTPYLRSLQNTPARKAWADPHELGAPARSPYMPPAFANLPNAGFPERQVPLRTGDAPAGMDFPEISWDDVRRSVDAGKLWLVVDGFVYDLTAMRDVHPGGAGILARWAGKDASAAFHNAAHTPGTLTFSLNYRIGRVVAAPVAAGV